MGSIWNVANDGKVTVTNDLAVDTNVLKVDTTLNRVGVNVTSPAYPLDIVGDLNLSTGSLFKINGTQIALSNLSNGSDATLKSTLTAKGSIYVASAASTPTGLTVGADATILMADIAQTTGAKWVALSGDVTIGVGGVTAIGSLVIVDGDVNASAAIAGTKINPSFGAQNLTVGTTALYADFATSKVGIGTASLGSYSLTVANGASIVTGNLYVGSGYGILFGTGANYGLLYGEIGTGASGKIVLQPGNAEVMRLIQSGSVGIGTGASINASAILDLTSITLGFLPPRMTTAQRNAIVSPATALTIYNTSTNQLNIYTGVWSALSFGTVNGHAVQDEGTPLTQRGNLNFVGTIVTATDDAGNDASKISINNFQKFTVTYTQLAVAALTNDIELFSLPSKGVVKRIITKHSVPFTGGSVSAYTLSVGISGDLTKYSSAFNVFQAAGNTTAQISNGGFIENFGAVTSVRIAAVSVGDNLNSATAGSVDVWVEYEVLP